MSTEPQSTFPTDERDYRYRYRIAEIESIKSEYESIYKFIDDNKKKIFPVVRNSRGADELDEKSKKFLERLEKLKEDFEYYADKIINKTDITSNEEYTHNMENLMLIAGDTILGCEEAIILNEKAECNKKLEYNGKKSKVKDVVGMFKNIPYELDRDAPLNVVMDRYQPVILMIIGILFFIIVIFTLLIIVLPVASYVNSFYYWLPFENNFSFLIALEALSLTLWLGFKINYSFGYRMTLTRSEIYSKTKDIIYKPFENKYKRRFGNLAKAFKVILSFVQRK